MPYKTKEAKRVRHAAYMKARYHADPEFRRKYIAACALHRAKQKAALGPIIDAAKAGGCRVCGESSICCLAFHHLNPTAKEFTISTAAARKISPARLLAELAKCLCVCHNCHAKIHAGCISINAVAGSGVEPDKQG